MVLLEFVLLHDNVFNGRSGLAICQGWSVVQLLFGGRTNASGLPRIIGQPLDYDVAHVEAMNRTAQSIKRLGCFNSLLTKRA